LEEFTDLILNSGDVILVVDGMLSFDFKQAYINTVLSLKKFQLLKFIPVKPRYLVLRVTENCNSRCITCNAWKNHYKDELSFDEIRDILRQCRDFGIDSVRLSGGEPLLREDIADIVQVCSHLGFKEIYVGTNGLLLKEKARELIESGVTRIGLSIDGVGEVNDLIRGVPGTYKRVIEGIKTVNAIKREKGLKLDVVNFTTILTYNIDQIPNIIRICQKLGVKWGFNLLDANIHLFQGIDVQKLRVKDEAKIDKLMDYLLVLRRRLPGLIYACEHVIEFGREYLKNPDSAKRIPCVLGYAVLLVRSHGEIFPGCPILGPVGNFRKNKLTDVLKSEKYKRYAMRMYIRDCPGCSFFCGDNAMISNIWAHKLKCEIMGF